MLKLRPFLELSLYISFSINFEHITYDMEDFGGLSQLQIHEGEETGLHVHL
jgi:hypothetical protein